MISIKGSAKRNHLDNGIREKIFKSLTNKELVEKFLTEALPVKSTLNIPTEKKIDVDIYKLLKIKESDWKKILKEEVGDFFIEEKDWSLYGGCFTPTEVIQMLEEYLEQILGIIESNRF